MLKRLELKNCFKHQHAVFDFTTGLTAITGPNESGKSLIFEMISFALFGSVALRGSAEDYKKLSVALDFNVMGIDYRVTRAGSKCVLYIQGNELASGTKVVNPKIVEILGYDFKVFTVANCANQDELLKLGNMKPTERKGMVDNVIGLTIIDKLTASVTQKISQLNTEVEIMRVNLIEPVMPVKPDSYEPLITVRAKIQELTPKQERFNFLQHWFQIPRVQPTPPVDPGVETLEVLMQKSSDQQVKYNRLREVAAKVAAYNPPQYTLAQLQSFEEAWSKIDSYNILLNQQARLSPAPAYTKEQLDQWTKDSETWKLWQEHERLIAQGNHTCPKCAHSWPVASNELKKLGEVQRVELPKHVPIPQDYEAIKRYESEESVRTSLAAQIAALGTWEAPPLSQDLIAAEKRSLAEQEHMPALIKEHDELVAHFNDGMINYQHLIQQRQQYENHLAIYEQAIIEWNQYCADYAANHKEYQELQYVPQEIARLRQVEQIVLIYDSQIDTYNSQVAAWEAKGKEIEVKAAQLNQFERSRLALKEARSTVKKFLVPSLNRVASALLAQMTGGSRSNIEISEDFEIMVDGQALNTLSGSGKAVANLAIRIALGQVLIAKKFPVFMADEIDGSMDDERAEFTSECLRRLTKHVPQLLLISHKRPDADHYIELGR